MLPTSEQIGKDLEQLAQTDASAAMLKRAVEATAYVLKKQRYVEFLDADGNNEERKAKAEIAEKVIQAAQNHHQAIEDNEAMQNQRKTLQLRIDVWRSLNANRRQGNV